MKIMRQGIKIDEKTCDRVSCGRKFFRVPLKQLIMYTFGDIFMRQGILLGHFYATEGTGCREIRNKPPSLP